MLDFIIVGQGLSGSLLSWYLLQHNSSFKIIDNSLKDAATTVGLGIINPVTGRRLVKSWKIEDLLPFAHDCYQAIGHKLNQQLVKETQVYRAFQSIKEVNDFEIRRSDFEAYIKLSDYGKLLSSFLKTDLGGFEISGLEVNFTRLNKSLQTYFTDLDVLIQSHFDYSQLLIKEDFVEYQNLKAKRIIFCEGPQAINNPWFANLAFNLAKGQWLMINCPGLAQEKIIKQDVLLIPASNNLFKVGATYEWKQDNYDCTTEGKTLVLDRLNKVLKAPYTVISQHAGMRPTTKDRRPFLGQHNEYPSLYVFNGLGTKGASLGPYFAKKMAEHLVKGSAIDKEVSLYR